MTKPQFSASSLQDYSDCPRRYELKYLQKLDWPVQPNSIEMEEGKKAHRLVQQYLMGFPTELLPAEIGGHTRDDMCRLLDTFCRPDWPVQQVEHPVQWENELAVFTGVFDLIQYDGQRLLIFDWKTDKHFGSKTYFAGRVQTKFYFWLAGKLYPTANETTLSIVSLYTGSMHRFTSLELDITDIETELTTLLTEIKADTYNRTTDVKHCRYCPFDRYCN